MRIASNDSPHRLTFSWGEGGPGLVLGGFLTPLFFLPNVSATSQVGLIPLVLGGGLIGSILAYGLFRWFTRHAG